VRFFDQILEESFAITSNVDFVRTYITLKIEFRKNKQIRNVSVGANIISKGEISKKREHYMYYFQFQCYWQYKPLQYKKRRLNLQFYKFVFSFAIGFFLCKQSKLSKNETLFTHIKGFNKTKKKTDTSNET
jgi:hypothetical protein